LLALSLTRRTLKPKWEGRRDQISKQGCLMIAPV
jgi:hypothetical protein